MAPHEPEMSAAQIAEYNQRMASRTRKEKFKEWFNDGNGKYLGREPKSWGKILGWYLMFYSFMTFFFAMCMLGLLSTLPDTSDPSGPVYVSFTEFRLNSIQGSLNIDVNSINTDASVRIAHNAQYYSPIQPSIPLDSVTAAGLNYQQSYTECNQGNAYGASTGKPCLYFAMQRLFTKVPSLNTVVPGECKITQNDANNPQTLVFPTNSNILVGNVQTFGIYSACFPFTGTGNYPSTLQASPTCNNLYPVVQITPDTTQTATDTTKYTVVVTCSLTDSSEGENYSAGVTVSMRNIP
eukprot:Nk52_evm1s1743 gene=Nk52_evmTU1s1743